MIQSQGLTKATQLACGWARSFALSLPFSVSPLQCLSTMLGHRYFYHHQSCLLAFPWIPGVARLLPVPTPSTSMEPKSTSDTYKQTLVSSIFTKLVSYEGHIFLLYH